MLTQYESNINKYPEKKDFGGIFQDNFIINLFILITDPVSGVSMTESVHPTLHAMASIQLTLFNLQRCLLIICVYKPIVLLL